MKAAPYLSVLGSLCTMLAPAALPRCMVAAEAKADKTVGEPAKRPELLRTEKLIEVFNQRPRVWTDSSGERQTTAVLIAANESVARFRKPGGKEVATQLTRLSVADRRYVIGALGLSRKAEPAASSLSRGMSTWFNGITKPAPVSNQPTAPTNMIYVRLGRPFLARFIEQNVQWRGPVTDRILNTAIFGTADTAGSVSMMLVPDSRYGRADLIFSGTAYSTTTGYNGPIRIHSNGVTQFASRKSLWFDPQGVRAAPSQTRTITRTQTTGISTDLRRLAGRIAVGIASRRVAASRAAADRIAGQRAAERISREWDQAVERRLANITQSMAGELEKLVVDPTRAVDGLEYSTTHDYVQVVVLRPRSAGGARMDAPVPDADRPDVEVQVHSSLVQNPIIRSQMPRLLRGVISSFLTESFLKTLGAEPPLDLAADWTVASTQDNQWLTLTWRAMPQLAKQDSRVAGRR
jgi:hypothetical protein